MSAAKHTPAPWRYEAPDEVCIKDADGGRVAILTNLRGALGMSGRRDPNEVIANARLIATAPELLEALRRLEVAANTVAYCHDKHRGNFAAALSDMESEAEAARAAIAKAEVQS